MHKDKVTVSSREFFQAFPDNESARKYLEDRRWKGQPVCPFCSAKERIQSRKVVGYFRCLACKKDFTVRTGTVFERSHVQLHLWLYAMYLVVTARKGVSSLQLSKELGITQKSAWFLLQRIREVCSNGKANPLMDGVVELDETYIGGKEKNKHANKKLKAGRGTVGKVVVMGARQRGGRVDALVVADTSAKTIQAKVRQTVAPGATICTDDHSSYQGMAEYIHKAVNHSAKQYVDGMAHTNSIESVWALLKRGFYGTHHWFSAKHVQRYVDEATFRLNEGNCKVHTYERIEALVARTEGVRITYKQVTN